nr:hypothetical protein [Clostridia bacterium]
MRKRKTDNKVDDIKKVRKRARKQNSSLNIVNIFMKAFKEAFEAETTQAGRVNLLGGFVVAVIVTLVCIPTTAMIIIEAIFPNFQASMPWYGVIILVMGICGYFIICVKFLLELDKIKK